jgi:hypothetical protein
MWLRKLTMSFAEFDYRCFLWAAAAASAEVFGNATLAYGKPAQRIVKCIVTR